MTFVLSGCGGGGGGVVTLLATLQALLQAANETHAVTVPDAQGAVVVQIMSDGEIRFSVTVQDAWRGDVSAAHIHRGAAGVPGGIEVDLEVTGVPDDGTLTVSGAVTTTQTLANEIANTPGDFYVNVHTNADPVGLVRAQLEAFAALECHSTLLGSEEVPAGVDADQRGAVTLAFPSFDTIRYVVALGEHDIDDATLAGIHVGASGVAAPLVDPADPLRDALVDLTAAADTTVDTDLRTITGTVTIGIDVLARLLANLGGHHVNVHTIPDAPAGLVRGQLAKGAVEMWAALSSTREVPDPSPGTEKFGGATIRFDTFTTGNAILAVPVGQDNGLGDVIDARVHAGAAGVNGAPVIPLMSGATLDLNTISGSAEGSFTHTQELLTRIMAAPEAFYVTIHTTAAPAGLVRNQLTDQPETFLANLAQPLGPGSGQLNLQFTGIERCQFALTLQSVPIGDVVSSDIHDSIGDQLLINLLAGQTTTAGSSITGSATFTGRTFARMLADSTNYDCRTDAGAVQLQGGVNRITNDVPPTNLAYADNPAVYQTNTAIAPSVPGNEGGAITGYAVSPALPAGLVLDATTGILSGTPTASSPLTTYTITGSNLVGSTSADVDITVNEAPPTNLTYTTPVTYTVGTPITPNVPTSGGGTITTYSAPGGLPPGLSLFQSTGALTGTPTTASAANGYTIQGSNSAGSTQTTVNITVTAGLQPPSNLSYSAPNPTYTTGCPITANVPTIGGGAVSSWSISPSLPAALSFNTGNGHITGTPTATSSQITYTVTASNAAGSTQATLGITVNLGLPGAMTLSATTVIAYVNTAINNVTLTHACGGTVASYSISPALVSGLSFDTSNGTISGTPTSQDLTGTTHTITATNTAGSVTAQVTIIVY